MLRIQFLLQYLVKVETLEFRVTGLFQAFSVALQSGWTNLLGNIVVYLSILYVIYE